jgi:hypothetical protein
MALTCSGVILQDASQLNPKTRPPLAKPVFLMNDRLPIFVFTSVMVVVLCCPVGL